MAMKDFKQKLSNTPTAPGSYQMKNKDGVIIYVGKAKNLQKRLRSYFTKSQTGKTLRLVEEIDDFEYIVTSSELESLILEITLIKKYNPKYNILLKDDKTYPYIELTNEKYPRVRVVRNVKRKRNKNYLYGPFPNVKAARKTVNIINRIYPLRKCDRLPKEVCLYYHIGECLGYCAYDVDEEIINTMKKEIISFLKGDSSIITKKIKEEMQKASDNLNYERALELKEMLTDIDITLSKQKLDLRQAIDFDVINYYTDKNYVSIQIFFIRDGLLTSRHEEIFSSINKSEDEIIEYIIKFYDNLGIVPKEIIIPESINKDLLEEYYQNKVLVPKKGKYKKLLDLAYTNAKDKLLSREEKEIESNQSRLEAIDELSSLLGRKVSKMEAFDNSHLFGTFYVGGMVVYDDFIPLKNEYRKYKLSLDVKDDLKAMHEVLYRRYFKLLMENLPYPDLIVMDGGKTQINVAKEVISSLKLDIPIIGLVKDSKHRTSYIMDENYNVLEIKKDSKLLLFLTKMQEEVHRFAITYHRNIKSKGALVSVLDSIPGVGEKRRKSLIREFGSLKKLKEASVEEIDKVIKNKTDAEKIYKYLKEI